MNMVRHDQMDVFTSAEAVGRCTNSVHSPTTVGDGTHQAIARYDRPARHKPTEHPRAHTNSDFLCLR